MNVIYIVVFLSLMFTVFLVVWTIVSWTRAKERREILMFLHHQLDRAVEQVKTDDINEIGSGLEVISVFNSPAARVAVLPRLNELKNHDNNRIADLAKQLEADIFHSIENLSQTTTENTAKT